ncbi:MAG: hypothetical protein KDJ75_04850 [Alphaproteobacteria bacterium]|nr:hypothetical protein [Alphaproteobacteria bacterium]
MALILDFNLRHLQQSFLHYSQSETHQEDQEALIARLKEGHAPETQAEIKAETEELCAAVCTLIDHRLNTLSLWQKQKTLFDKKLIPVEELLSVAKVMADRDNTLALTPEYQRDTSRDTIPERLFSFYEETRKKFNTFKGEYTELDERTNQKHLPLLPAPLDSKENTSDLFNRKTGLNSPATALNAFEHYINTTMPDEVQNVIQTLTTDLEQGIGMTLRRSIAYSQKQAIERTRDILNISKLWAAGLERQRQGKQNMTALLSDLQRLLGHRKQVPDINREHLPAMLLKHWESAEKIHENTKNAVNTFYYHTEQTSNPAERKVIPLFQQRPPSQ